MGTFFTREWNNPKLKGTRPITVVKPKKKTKRRSQEEILLTFVRLKKKAALKKEFKKQKDF